DRVARSFGAVAYPIASEYIEYSRGDTSVRARVAIAVRSDWLTQERVQSTGEEFVPADAGDLLIEGVPRGLALLRFCSGSRARLRFVKIPTRITGKTYFRQFPNVAFNALQLRLHLQFSHPAHCENSSTSVSPKRSIRRQIMTFPEHLESLQRPTNFFLDLQLGRLSVPEARTGLAYIHENNQIPMILTAIVAFLLPECFLSEGARGTWDEGRNGEPRGLSPLVERGAHPPTAPVQVPPPPPRPAASFIYRMAMCKTECYDNSHSFLLLLQTQSMLIHSDEVSDVSEYMNSRARFKTLNARREKKKEDKTKRTKKRGQTHQQSRALQNVKIPRFLQTLRDAPAVLCERRRAAVKCSYATRNWWCTRDARPIEGKNVRVSRRTSPSSCRDRRRPRIYDYRAYRDGKRDEHADSLSARQGERERER
ncbi:hypothetical protein ALC56_07685, partial [Trachymyrmex septentrionalis]